MTTPELDLGSWVDRCTRRLMALDPQSPLDATDWDDISSDLWAIEPRRAPEKAAEEWHHARTLARGVEQD